MPTIKQTLVFLPSLKPKRFARWATKEMTLGPSLIMNCKDRWETFFSVSDNYSNKHRLSLRKEKSTLIYD
jgi:hypothetical protein